MRIIFSNLRILALTIVLFYTFSASAQLKIGVQGGVTFNKLETSSSFAYDRQYDNRTSFTVGIPVRYEFTDWFALQAEVNYLQKNYGMHRTYVYEKNRYNYTNDFIDIPVLARFSFGGEKLRGYTLVGGYIGGWVSSRVRGVQQYYFASYDAPDNILEINDIMQFDSRRDNRFDAGLIAGLGLQWQVCELIEIFAEGRYYYGLTDMQKDYMQKQVPRYNSTLAVQIGVMFTISNL